METNINIERIDADHIKISFAGRLNADTVANLWDEAIATVNKENSGFLILDFKNVDYCDGAGIALIKVLQKKQYENSRNCDIQNLRSDFKNLLEYIEKQPDAIELSPIVYGSFPIHLGHVAVNLVKGVRDNITFLGSLSYQLFFTLLNPRKIRWSDFIRIAEDTGPHALPIIALIGFLIGLISTFQAAPSFANFGAQIYIVDLVGLGLVREMGPLLTAVLLTGRTASSFAAEIGTMKINQEIDALSTMGLNSIRFLVIPRVLVTMMVSPILEIFFIIFGLLGSLTVMISLGYTADSFFNRLYEAIIPIDYVGGLIKIFIFGLVIASIGCLHGIKTKFGAMAVGHSTTQAVVSSLVMLVIIDGIFALIYYILGI